MQEILFNKSRKDVIVSGHRGALALYPENTMVSYKKAIELGLSRK